MRTQFRLKTLFLVALALTCVTLFWGSTELRACMADCDICWQLGCSSCSVGDGGVTCSDCGARAIAAPATYVRFLSPTHARITVQGYKTTNLQPLNSCVTALSPVEGIDRVNSITNYDGTTGRPFQQITFSPTDKPGPEIAALAREQGVDLATEAAWAGFLSRITGTVHNNTPNFFVIDVTLKEGVAVDQFVESLRSQGVFATSSSTPDGIPNPGHQFFRRFGRGEIFVLFPQREGDPGHKVQ
jgi:hypothetical protein